jgi:hypothetical protein
MDANPEALYIWHWKVSSMALCVLYRTRQAEKAGRDWTTALATLGQKEQTLIPTNSLLKNLVFEGFSFSVSSFR